MDETGVAGPFAESAVGYGGGGEGGVDRGDGGLGRRGGELGSLRIGRGVDGGWASGIGHCGDYESIEREQAS